MIFAKFNNIIIIAILIVYHIQRSSCLSHVGPLAARAALYTAGVVGGLTLTAACAPSDKFLYWSGPLSLGLGVVFVASIGGLHVNNTIQYSTVLYM